MDHSGDTTALTGMLGAFFVVYAIFICAMIALSIWIHWRILAKAGYNGALSLLILTGIGGLVIVLILAFGKWPIETELEMLRAGSRPPLAGPIGGPPMTTA